MNANLTNTISDVILASFIFILYTMIIFGSHRDNPNKSYITSFFLSSSIGFGLGILGHFFSEEAGVNNIWISIGLISVFINYSAVYSAYRFPHYLRQIVMLISLISVFLFLKDYNFLYIALSSIIVSSLVFVYTRNLTRIGFIALTCSNIIYIVVQLTITLYLGHNIPIKYSYHHDLYHFFMGVSFYILYKSFKRGNWI